MQSLSLVSNDRWHASCGRFELVEMARKVMLISVLSVVNEDADSYLWAAFIVSFASQILFSTLKPYEGDRYI